MILFTIFLLPGKEGFKNKKADMQICLIWGKEKER